MAVVNKKPTIQMAKDKQRESKQGSKMKSSSPPPKGTNPGSAGAEVSAVEAPYLNLSIDNPVKMGFNIMPEGFIMCNEIFELLFDRIDEAMMRKRVDKEYKMYSVNNAI